VIAICERDSALHGQTRAPFALKTFKDPRWLNLLGEAPLPKSGNLGGAATWNCTKEADLQLEYMHIQL